MNRYSKYAMSEKGKERSRRYKEKNVHKVNAQNKALTVHPEERICSIKNCLDRAERHHPTYDNPELIVWLCRRHHLLIHGKVRAKCSQCGKESHAKNLCKAHYAREYRKQQGW